MENDEDDDPYEEHVGRKKLNMKELTCSVANGDTIILGFGNGAVAVLSTRCDHLVAQDDELIKKIDLKFSKKPIEKLRVIHIERQGRVYQLLLSLSGTMINCHFLPNLEKCEADLEADKIIDFEPYQCPKGQSQVHLLAALFKFHIIKVYMFDIVNFSYRFVSYFKVNPYPIFDGGIAVYKNVFLI